MLRPPISAILAIEFCCDSFCGIKQHLESKTFTPIFGENIFKIVRLIPDLVPGLENTFLDADAYIIAMHIK
jgi:hypothetical protein